MGGLCEREPFRLVLADALFPSRLPACQRSSAFGREGTCGFHVPFLAVKSRGPKQLLYGQRNGVRGWRCLRRPGTARRACSIGHHDRFLFPFASVRGNIPIQNQRSMFMDIITTICFSVAGGIASEAGKSIAARVKDWL